MRWR